MIPAKTLDPLELQMHTHEYQITAIWDVVKVLNNSSIGCEDVTKFRLVSSLMELNLTDS
jgi:hypothetical protein